MIELDVSQHYIGPFSKFWKKKKSWLEKMNYLLILNESRVFLHNFWKWQHTNLSKNVLEIFCQADKLFSAEIWKMTKCRFCFNVMLRQPLIQASRGWGWLYSKNFSWAIFFYLLRNSFGWLVFELFACETNLQEKHRVNLC